MKQSKGGTVLALGVASPKRWPCVPDVSAIAETGPGKLVADETEKWRKVVEFAGVSVD